MFQSINTAVRGMQAQQKALETISHNVANANTPGFSRQQVVLAATSALSSTYGVRARVGTGVEVSQIRRVRADFLDAQWRKENRGLAQWQVRQEALQQVEVIFREPSDSGLGAFLNDFWNAWQELVKNPESLPVRTTVVEAAGALAETFRETYSALEDLRADLNQSLDMRVQEVNSLATQIAALNVQIANITQAGLAPNDLLDARDVLLDQLSGLVQYSMTTDPLTKSVTVQVDGRDLVNGASTLGLKTVPGVNGDLSVQWADNGVAVNPGEGQLSGYLQARGLVYSYRNDLDRLARGLLEQVNLQHRKGYDLYGKTFVDTNGDGVNDNPGYYDFFTGTGAGDLQVTQQIKDDPRHIAAASSAATVPGDGSNALKIAELRQQQVEPGVGPLLGTDSLVPAMGAGETFEDFYKDLMARLGVDAQQADRMTDNQQALLDQLERRREEASGVSLDEEMAGLIQYQRAFEASARVISVLDSMLDVLVNQLKR